MGSLLTEDLLMAAILRITDTVLIMGMVITITTLITDGADTGHGSGEVLLL
jgi:hypothetical protein